MEVTKITESEFRKMVLTASNKLNNNAKFINSLNVFPVPDGDTGTNMSLSLASGNKYVSESTSTEVGHLASALAKGLLMGARGNSGVILSQIFRGFGKAIEDKHELTAQDLTDALSAGVETAYKAVMKPQEGTILTVARKAAEAARIAVKNTDDCVVVMTKAHEGAKKALESTPDLLPVLKEVGVVDSGGQGLTFVYQGFMESLSGNVVEDEHVPNPVEMDEMINAEHHKSVQGQLHTEDIEFGYCTEIMVRLGAGRLVDSEFDYDTFRGHLAEYGDSLLVIADDEVVKVHVHTEHPGEVLSYGQHFGSLIKVKVDNMRLQHETILEKDKEEDTTDELLEKARKDAGDYGVMAVVSGKGLKELFISMGATDILDGGQTMNPSTEDFVEAINASSAKKFIIMPNNKNIFLAAKQAAQMVEKPVEVVESRSVLEGLSGLFAFSPDVKLQDNAESMREAIEEVTSGQVTIAVRDTTIDGQEIKKDDYMGIIDGKIKLTQKDAKSAAIEMAKAMIDEDSEVVTIIFGEDGNQEEAEAIEEAILEIDEDLEVEIHEGNQPVYPYLISVE